MASSIFSSDKRVALALGLLIAGVCIVAALNVVIHRSKSAGPGGADAEERFQKEKVSPSRKYDMVLLGDSRCLTGVDPAILEKHLGISVYNDSFSGGGLNNVIYRHAEENMLETASSGRVRAVVMCMTPSTLSGAARKNLAYNSIINDLKKKPDVITQYSKILFQKIRSRDIKALFRKPKVEYIYHSNGYLEKFSRVKAKAQRNGMRQYEVMFRTLDFPQINLDELAKQTREWRKKNIAVFAFYPPSRPVMEELETKKSSWNIKETVRVFTEAGGIFLEIDNRDQYNAYDSIHLASGEAKRLSQDLAVKLRAHLQKKGVSSGSTR